MLSTFRLKILALEREKSIFYKLGLLCIFWKQPLKVAQEYKKHDRSGKLPTGRVNLSGFVGGRY